MDHIVLTLLQKYPTHVKYWLLVISIFVMIVAIKNYLNYDNILYEIDLVKMNTDRTQQQILFTEKFLVPYLWSSYADYFLAHENSILYAKEDVVKFEFVDRNKDADLLSWNSQTWKKEKNQSWSTLSPKESWNEFIKSKLNK